jgi:hypothetical protein
MNMGWTEVGDYQTILESWDHTMHNLQMMQAYITLGLVQYNSHRGKRHQGRCSVEKVKQHIHSKLNFSPNYPRHTFGYLILCFEE